MVGDLEPLGQVGPLHFQDELPDEVQAGPILPGRDQEFETDLGRPLVGFRLTDDQSPDDARDLEISLHFGEVQAADHSAVLVQI